ncbi:hypothetical protein EON80_15810 [bacterium]|nr:MAG: hypothetical protein EON80_15810 [bacterium]
MDSTNVANEQEAGAEQPDPDIARLAAFAAAAGVSVEEFTEGLVVTSVGETGEPETDDGSFKLKFTLDEFLQLKEAATDAGMTVREWVVQEIKRGIAGSKA